MRSTQTTLTGSATPPTTGFPISRRRFLAGAAAAAGTGLLAGAPAAAGAALGSTGPYSLANGYFSLEGSQGLVTSLAFDPTGSAKYSANLLSAAGLYFGFVSDGQPVVAASSQTTYEVGPSALTLTIPIYSSTALAQTQYSNGYDIAEGGGAGQTFVAPSGSLARLGINLFAAFGEAPTGDLSVRILTGGPSGSEVFATTLTPADLAQISGGATLTYVDLSGLTLTAGGTYFIELITSDPDWAVQYEDAAVYSGGEFYGFGGLNPQPGKEMAFVLISTTGILEYQAVWVLSVDGPALSSTIGITSEQPRSVSSPGFEFSTAWVYGGYDVNDPATAPFRRYYDSGGQYLPVQVFKRRPAMSGSVAFESAGIEWIYFTGQQGYDLKFAWPDIVLQFSTSADTMTYTFGPGAPSTLAAGQALSFPFNMTVLPHSEAVPDWYPVFSCSDSLVDAYLSEFYWERAFEWGPGGVGTDWLYWMSLALDWQGGPLREGQRALIESIPVNPDGYAWTENPGEGWAFPSAPYDNRHFTPNAMYILGIAQYYAWTGDEQFLAEMLPSAEAAMEYYTNVLGGSSGLVTVDRGFIGTTGLYAHTAEDGAPGTNYWDLCSYGWKDGYVNLYFYGAIRALAELEAAAGNRAKAGVMNALGDKVRRVYNETFWREITLDDGRPAGRYVQAIDQRGVVHDHGATYLNLEAMSLGLPWQSYGEQILAWLDDGDTELTETLLFLQTNGVAVSIGAGDTAVQSFSAPGEFSHVCVQVGTNGNDDSQMTVSLYSGVYPDGTLVASRRYVGVWPEGLTNVIDFPAQPAGLYYVEISDTSGPLVWYGSTTSYPDGEAYLNGTVLSSPQNFSIVVVSPHRPGPHDIYSAWGWAPRATTRKNNFNYVFLWEGVMVPWGVQLEDGGADLYEVGFDVMARARYSSGDDAYSKMKSVLERFSLPDRLCGGPPLYLGENPEDELQAGAVGVDVPFPESGVAPAAFLHAILGIEATPTRLSIRPKLPSTMEWARVTNVAWRGRTLTITVYRHHLEVEGMPGPIQHHPYSPGERVILHRAPANRPPIHSVPPKRPPTHALPAMDPSVPVPPPPVIPPPPVGGRPTHG